MCSYNYCLLLEISSENTNADVRRVQNKFSKITYCAEYIDLSLVKLAEYIDLSLVKLAVFLMISQLATGKQGQSP